MYDDRLEHRVDGIVYVDGNLCHMYFVRDNVATICEKFDIRLISQFKTGGQSANRLSRIVDENRNIFIGKVVDVCIDKFYDKGQSIPKISNLVIYGPSKFKEDVAKDKKIEKHFNLNPNISEINKAICRTHILTVGKNDIDTVMAFLQTLSDPSEQRKHEEVMRLVELGGDRLEFGLENNIHLLHSSNLEKIYVSEDIRDELRDFDYESTKTKTKTKTEIVYFRSVVSKEWISMYGDVIGVRWF